MTPRSIETGRGLSATATRVSLDDDASAVIAGGAGDRVALSVAITGDSLTDAFAGVTIGTVLDGELVPLTMLNAGHPACYLSVDKIGVLVTAPITAHNVSGGAVVLGVSHIRQTHPFEAE